MVSTRERGALAEAQAATLLDSEGYRIVERNFRCRFGEIDIIAMAPEPSLLVFVEVRHRSPSRFASGTVSVDFRKQQRLIRTAGVYLALRQVPEQWRTRFDVISSDGPWGKLDWTPGAFWLEGNSWL